MKLLRFATVALLTGALMVACDDDDGGTPVTPVAPAPAPIVGTVSGTVSVESSGLPGVNVNLVGAAAQSATTGSSGGYSFGNVPAGTHGVQISGAPAEVAFVETSKVVTITTSGQTVPADFSGKYIRTSIISGTVLTAAGEGVVATVTATGGGMLMSEQAVIGTSDTDGDFILTGLRAGTFHVTISEFDDHHEFTVTSRDVTVGVGQSAPPVAFTAEAVPEPEVTTGSISGEVVTAAGDGIVATVTAVGTAEDAVTVTGTSDTEGDYELLVEAGDYTVTISDFSDDHEFDVTSRPVTVVAGEIANASFKAEAEDEPPEPEVTTGSITGEVVTAAGDGIVATVTAVGTAEDGVSVSGTSDTEGDYEFTEVEAGDYTVTISDFSDDHKFDVTSRPVTVVAGESANASFKAEDEPTTGTGVFLFITEVTDDNDDDSKTSGHVTVAFDIDRGDARFEKIALYVDDVEVDSRSFDFGPVSAAENAAELAAQQLVLSLSFNSAHYVPETRAVTYENGTYGIQVGVTVVGSEAEDRSDLLDVELENDDGVLVAVSGLGLGATNSATGQMWYGGPEAMIEITARPVLYSGGSASSVGIGVFCGAKAARVTEDPFTFTPTCKDYTSDAEGENPQFSIATENVETLNGEGIFPLYLDFEGPSAPTFYPNPNDREGGWVNETVDFLGKQGSKNKNGWLTYTAADAGVGGYTTRLRAAPAPVGKDGLKEALAAPILTLATLPGESEENAYCVVASAVDLLANESALPDPDEGDECLTAEVILDTGMEPKPDDPNTPDDESMDAVPVMQMSAIQAGVDLTRPEAIFAGVSLGKDAKALGGDQTRYILHLTDNSGVHMAEPVVDSLEIRGAGGNVDGAMTTPLPVHSSGLPLVNVNFDADGVGYYTYTARAQDMAGNLSKEISRTALHDLTPPVTALIFARGKNAFNYDKTLVMADNLSIRDYTVTISASNLPQPVRMNRAMVSGYDGDLEPSKTVTGLVVLPFIAVQSPASGPPLSTPRPQTNVISTDGVTIFAAHVTDQAGNESSDSETLPNITIDLDDLDKEDVNSGDGVATGISYVLTVKDDDGAIGADNNNMVKKSEETITLTVTATLALETTDNPFAKVYFFAEVDDINIGLASSADNRDELRQIGIFDGVHAKRETTMVRKWTYETEISAADYYATIGGVVGAAPSSSNFIHALAVNDKGVALPLTFGGTGTETALVIAKR